jgi:hypothetical protein
MCKNLSSAHRAESLAGIKRAVSEVYSRAKIIGMLLQMHEQFFSLHEAYSFVLAISAPRTGAKALGALAFQIFQVCFTLVKVDTIMEILSSHFPFFLEGRLNRYK